MDSRCALTSDRIHRIADMLSATLLHSDAHAEEQNTTEVKQVAEATIDVLVPPDSSHDGADDQATEKSSKTDVLADLYAMNFLEASLVATVLEDAIFELRLLDECNTMFRLMKTESDMKQLRAHKYGIKQPTFADDVSIDMNNLDKEETKLDKLTTDRQFVKDSLLYTYLDLALNNSYQALEEQISEITDRGRYRTSLMHEEANNKGIRRDLQKQLRFQRNRVKSDNYDMDNDIERLKKEVEDAILHSEARSRYTTNWEKARSEQNHQLIRVKERPAFQELNSLKQKLNSETRVHSEITMLVNISLNEMLEKVENIMSKYDKDMEEMDLKIQVTKMNYEETAVTRTELEDMYAKHEEEAKEWLTFKDKREKKRLYREKMQNAAVTAQAWWRGIMVRLELGPYKPPKTARSAKDGKKKKK